MLKKGDSEKKKEVSLENLKNNIDASGVLDLLINHLKQEHKFDSNDILSLVEKKKSEVMIPVSIFNDKLSSLEAIVKYLVEIVGMKNNKIALLLNRNIRTTWTTYNNANKKFPKKISVDKKDKFFIPIEKFQNRKFSVLEVVVKYLKEDYDIGLHEIALIMQRDDSTVWTVYNRATKKEKSKKKNGKK